MPKYHPKNEYLRREYLLHLRHGRGRSDSTLDSVNKSLLRYDEYNRYREIKGLHKEHIIGFKEWLYNQKAERSGKPLSKSTLLHTMLHVKGFFLWLSQEPGFKSKISIRDIEYFSISEKDARIARSEKPRPYPTIEQIRHVVLSMPIATEMERRNRALLAFTILTGIRDRAMVSLKLKHIDLIEELVIQDPAEVQTKFSKRIDTFFFPAGEIFKQIVIDWVKELREKMLYGYDAPLFPRTKTGLDPITKSFKAAGLEPLHWNNTEPVRKAFREAFIRAGVPYYNPHSFRNTLVQLGYKLCKTYEALKAWSQNLGHESMLTTLSVYGKVDRYRQGEIMAHLKANL